MSFIDIVISDYNSFETEGRVFYEEYYKILCNKNRNEVIMKIIPQHSLEKIYLFHKLAQNISEYNKLYELGDVDIDFLIDKYNNIKTDTLNEISLYGISYRNNHIELIYFYFKCNLSVFEKFIYYLDDIH